MTDRQLRHLRREELIDIIYTLQLRQEQLQKENAALRAELETRQLRVEKAGSLAEAALAVSGVLEAAQKKGLLVAEGDGLRLASHKVTLASDQEGLSRKELNELTWDQVDLDGGSLLWNLSAWLTEPYTADRVASAVSFGMAALLTLAAAAALWLGGSPFLLLAAMALFVRAVREIGLVKWVQNG